MGSPKLLDSPRPPVGFHFKVIFSFDDKEHECNFQEVSGLDTSFETETVKEGGENRYVHRLPGRPTFGNLILKRGMLIDSELLKILNDSVFNFNFTPMQVTVSLIGQPGTVGNAIPIASWAFHNAVPVKWSNSGLNAQESGIVVETIEMTYTYMNRVQLKTELVDTQMNVSDLSANMGA